MGGRRGFGDWHICMLMFALCERRTAKPSSRAEQVGRLVGRARDRGRGRGRDRGGGRGASLGLLHFIYEYEKRRHWFSYQEPIFAAATCATFFQHLRDDSSGFYFSLTATLKNFVSSYYFGYIVKKEI